MAEITLKCCMNANAHSYSWFFKQDLPASLTGLHPAKHALQCYQSCMKPSDSVSNMAMVLYPVPLCGVYTHLWSPQELQPYQREQDCTTSTVRPAGAAVSAGTAGVSAPVAKLTFGKLLQLRALPQLLSAAGSLACGCHTKRDFEPACCPGPCERGARQPKCRGQLGLC